MLRSDPQYLFFIFTARILQNTTKPKLKSPQIIIIDDDFSSSYKNVAELKPT